MNKQNIPEGGFEGYEDDLSLKELQPVGEVTEGDIAQTLTVNYLKKLTPDLYQRWVQSQKTNQEDAMRVDLEVAEKVGDLRESGQIPPREEIAAEAKRIFALEPSQHFIELAKHDAKIMGENQSS